MLSDFFRPPPHTARVSIGLLVLRVVLGVIFVQYGLQKIHAPMSWAGAAQPAAVQIFACVAELGGGLLLIVGALTPLAAALIVIDMIGAMVASGSGTITVEKNVIYGICALVLLFTGPGMYSIDELIARREHTSSLPPRR
jgi:putative oxidoreductase